MMLLTRSTSALPTWNAVLVTPESKPSGRRAQSLGCLRSGSRDAADPVTVVLLGEPVAWARTRINKSGALFTPARQRNNAAALKLAAQQVMANRLPFDGPDESTCRLSSRSRRVGRNE